MITIKRVYEPAEPADGHRILVERLWPRGISKEKAQVEEWLKDIAPSPALRTWYGHKVEKWPEFVERYRRELAGPENVGHLKRLAELGRKGTLTLVFAARDEQHNSALVLREVLQSPRRLRK